MTLNDALVACTRAGHWRGNDGPVICIACARVAMDAAISEATAPLIKALEMISRNGRHVEMPCCAEQRALSATVDIARAALAAAKEAR